MIDKSIDITNLIIDQTGVKMRIFCHLPGRLRNYSDADFSRDKKT